MKHGRTEEQQRICLALISFCITILSAIKKNSIYTPCKDIEICSFPLAAEDKRAGSTINVVNSNLVIGTQVLHILV